MSRAHLAARWACLLVVVLLPWTLIGFLVGTVIAR